jgi:type III secretion protein J
MIDLRPAVNHPASASLSHVVSRHRRHLLLPAALVMAVGLAGCAKQLLGSLDETGANQVVGALRLEGITADKAAEGEKGWKVTVPDAQFAVAEQILERRNLPAPPFQGLGQVFKKESLVSTPTEERARLIHAMSQELERSLTEIDGVLIARVHPVILPDDPLNPRHGAASASVLIKYRPGMDLSSREGMIRSLVAAGIEGLGDDNVRVVMVPADESAPTRATPLATPLADAFTRSRQGMAAWQRQPLPYIGAAAALGAALLMWFVGMQRLSRSDKPGAGLHGRWTETVNSVFHETARRSRPSRSPAK